MTNQFTPCLANLSLTNFIMFFKYFKFYSEWVIFRFLVWIGSSIQPLPWLLVSSTRTSLLILRGSSNLKFYLLALFMFTTNFRLLCKAHSRSNTVFLLNSLVKNIYCSQLSTHRIALVTGFSGISRLRILIHISIS